MRVQRRLRGERARGGGGGGGCRGPTRIVPIGVDVYLTGRSKAASAAKLVSWTVVHLKNKIFLLAVSNVNLDSPGVA